MATLAVCMVSLAGGGSRRIGERKHLFGTQLQVRICLPPRRACASRLCIRATDATAAATPMIEEEDVEEEEEQEQEEEGQGEEGGQDEGEGEGEEEGEAEEEEDRSKPVPRLKALYREKVMESLKKEFKYKREDLIPKLIKITLNCTDYDDASNAKKLEKIKTDISLIAGQCPCVVRATKSISNLKLRKGQPVGVRVTLRRDMMYYFLDRLINIALPRTRDFDGVNPHSFDRGNLSLCVKDMTVFPEIDIDAVDKVRGFDVAICTSALTDKEAERLLNLLGMPFNSDAQKRKKVRKPKTWSSSSAPVPAKQPAKKKKAPAKKK